MRILLIGNKGMLGSKLQNILEKNQKVFGSDLPEDDITNLDRIMQKALALYPDIIINTAAYNDVDGSEVNAGHAFAVNAQGPRNLALVCNQLNIPLVHFSTDYIFDGLASSPYQEWDSPNPQSIYGKSKLLGEEYVRDITPKHYIIRSSWLYGPNGKNFVDTMLRLAKDKNEICVVNDQTGSPTYTVDLAQAVDDIITEPTFGTYHITNSGNCTWFEFTIEIFEQAGIEGVKVKPITTGELNRPAPRPRYSVLDNFNWCNQGFKPLRHYREALREYLAEVKDGK